MERDTQERNAQMDRDAQQEAHPDRALETGKGRGPGWVMLGLLPLLGLGILLALIVVGGAGIGREDVPPVEELTVNRVTMPSEGKFVVSVTNGGPDPVTIEQVSVNEALWDFEAEPSNTISPRETAAITIPYPWVEGEAYAIGLISETGATFEGEVPLAVLTPGFSADILGRYALIGFYVGVIPVSLGLLFYPFLRRVGTAGMNFVLALTIGLLAYLVIDTLFEAMEIAGELPGFLSGVPLVLLLASLTVVFGLLGSKLLSRREQTGLPTSYRISGGIGLHNLGEGLAIGAAFALGEAALGTFLVIGFTLHNITEGVGIAAPVLKDDRRPSLWHFGALALLGGGPAILGTWIAGFAYSNLLASVFLAIAVGALVQVIYEVGLLLLQESAESKMPAFSVLNLVGLTAGVSIMYATGLLTL
ncbi:MAG: Zinc transporter, ZIP family [uncultured Rubrobacteraceae bacterium]|uniref:Zinc transporter, ZIP family n=1 Tax=uncultured Rubrobacteraceae bacterium TaxID=349277 RepID=A0A6J4QTW2_9ACTN|nr:MAG: Zinc transporter, ZIP family [uncultured Rubrobacteraceae bacterium]